VEGVTIEKTGFDKIRQETETEAPEHLTVKDAETEVKDESDRLRAEKGYILSGLVVLLPLTVIAFILNWFFVQISLLPGSQMLSLTNIYVIDQAVKLGALLVFGLFIVGLTGRAVRTNGGFRAEKTMDKIFTSIPIIGSIYRITKVTADTVTGSSKELRKPVKITINDMRVTAFKTGNVTKDGRPILFLPTAPNITTGIVLEAKPEQIINSDETGEEALTRVLSAGFGQDSS